MTQISRAIEAVPIPCATVVSTGGLSSRFQRRARDAPELIRVLPESMECGLVELPDSAGAH